MRINVTEASNMTLDLNIDNFLKDHWQQKPLLIRNAIPNFRPPIDANELAGLAMENEVESRIIETLPDTWALSHGPFEQPDFDRNRPWTLLVQAADHYVQEVAELLKLVNFLPNWRVDDVMVSYAVDGGSVGPHYDNYDVFLVQGEGTKHWQLGQMCDSASPLLAHPDLRILKNFECTEEYTLETGDILYVPPGLAHWGIAAGECTTFSLGFRAPRTNDMLSRWVDEILESIDPEDFYSDAGQNRVSRAGEIRAEDYARVKQQLASAVEKHISNRWFGELVTEPRYAAEEATDGEIRYESQLLAQGASLVTLLPSSKLAWQEAGEQIIVYANGNSLDAPSSVLPVLTSLCEQQQVQGDTLSRAISCTESLALLNALLSMACITVE